MTPAATTVESSPAPVLCGVGGALLLAPVELWQLAGAGWGPAWVSVVLLATLGLAVGLGIVAGAALAARFGRGPWTRALLWAVPSLVVTIPTAAHLFDGAFAATLPGAASGPLWVPALGLIGLVIAIRLATIVVHQPWGRRGLAVVLFGATLALDLVNRTVKRSEAPDVHTALLVVEVAALAVGLGLVWPHRRLPRARRVRVTGITGAVVAVGLVLAMPFGLAHPEARMAVATRGLHTRLLVRVLRGVLDLDRDGHAAVLGGGDCNDFDAAIHPDAQEVPGNDVDENCDGLHSDAAALQALLEARKAHLARLQRWREEPEVRRFLATTRQLNVMLVGIDALRADMLAPTAANRAQFPNLFALLDESLWFRHSFAPAAGTDLSMSGVLTGKVDPFGTDQPTLAESLAATGRHTHAVIPSEVVRYVGKAMLTRGLDGFDRVVNDRYAQDVGTYFTGAKTNALGLKFIDGVLAEGAKGAEVRFFVWLHYFDVHEHHELKPAAFRELFGDVGELGRVERYRLALAAVDLRLGELIAALKQRSLWDQTMVVLVSDHGEGLGEDPRLPENHGRFVYNALVHVPMAVRIPGVDGRVIEAPVSLLDVYPTVLELAGAAPARVDGESLLAHLVPGAPTELRETTRTLPLNETDQYGVVQWPYKLMVRREDRVVELYDLASDFDERHNLADADPDRVQELQAAYAALPTVAIDRSKKGRRQRERAATRAQTR